MKDRSSRGRVSLIVLVLLAAGFAVALFWLLNARLSKGDTYPIYSTFRSDPLGARVLYEALERMDGVKVERNTRRLKRIGVDEDTAVWFLGLKPSQFHLEDNTGEQEILDAWLKQGCRIVISLSAKSSKQEPLGWLSGQSDSYEDQEDEEAAEELEFYAGVYGLTLTAADQGLVGLPQEGEGEFESLSLPVWRGGHQLTFDPDSGWEALAYAGEAVTMATLKREKGEIIVVADSYPLSNEAQVNERHTPYILALLGDHGRIVMDESHHGVMAEPGLVRLVRHYHMQGLLIGGLVLFVFLLWQGGGGLIPADPDRDIGEDGSGVVSGRDSSGGLVSLLEVGLKPAQVMQECIERHLSHARGPKPNPDQVQQARAIAAASRKGSLAEDHARIAAIFKP